MDSHKGQQYDRFAYFNILRFSGAFCIAVFLHYNDHLLPFLGIENPFSDHPFAWAVSHNSWVFVEMYFIISGILFSVAYQKKIADGLPFDRFMTKRILRIYPLMVLTSIFMYVGNWLLYAYNGTLWSCGTLSFTELLLDIVFGGKVVFNAGPTLNGPIWYINVLLVCYALAYLLTKLSSKQQSNLVFVLPVLLGLIIQYSGKSFALFNGSAARGFISFFEGVLLASVLKGAPNRGGGGGAPLTLWGPPPPRNGLAVFMGARLPPRPAPPPPP